MTSADFVLLAVVAVSAMVAFVRGFVREVLGIIAWVAAAYVAYKAFPAASPIVSGWISNKQFAGPATYGIVFVIALIVFTIATNLLGRVVRNSALGGLDRTLGLAYGVLRGAVIGMVAYIVAGMAIPPAEWPQPVRAARLLPFTHAGAVWLAGLLPAGFEPKVAALDEKNVLPLPSLLTPAVIGGKLPLPGLAPGAPAASQATSPAAPPTPTPPASGQGAPPIPPAFAPGTTGAASPANPKP
jgi:membrane protein required for colicin V production